MVEVYNKALGAVKNPFYINNKEVDLSGKKVSITKLSEEITWDASPHGQDIWGCNHIFYHDAVHFIGNNIHLTYDGKNWKDMGDTLPHPATWPTLVVYNDEIHMLGAYQTYTKYGKYHYKYIEETNSWEKVSTLPYAFYQGCAGEYMGTLRIFGGVKSSKYHRLYNGTKWASAVSLNEAVYDNKCVKVIDGHEMVYPVLMYTFYTTPAKGITERYNRVQSLYTYPTGSNKTEEVWEYSNPPGLNEYGYAEQAIHAVGVYQNRYLFAFVGDHIEMGDAYAEYGVNPTIQWTKFSPFPSMSDLNDYVFIGYINGIFTVIGSKNIYTMKTLYSLRIEGE